MYIIYTLNKTSFISFMIMRNWGTQQHKNKTTSNYTIFLFLHMNFTIFRNNLRSNFKIKYVLLAIINNQFPI